MNITVHSRGPTPAGNALPPPAWMPPPLAPAWPASPFRDLSILDNSIHLQIRWSIRVHPDALPLALALGAEATSTPPGWPTILSHSPALLLRIAPLLGQRDRDIVLTGVPGTPVLSHATFGAPSLFMLRHKTSQNLRIAGSHFRLYSTRQFLFLCPRAFDRIPAQLGWQWYKSLQCWLTTHTQAAAALAAFADEPAADAIARFGTPKSLHPYLRTAPALLPGSRVFHFVTDTSGPKRLPAPEHYWKSDLGGRPSYTTRHATIAARAAAYAPKPLADILANATPDILSTLTPGKASLAIQQPEGVTAAPPPPKPELPPIRWCPDCNRVSVCTERLARRAAATPCPSNACDNHHAALETLLPHIASADKRSWRAIAYHCASRHIESRRAAPVPAGHIETLRPRSRTFLPHQPEAIEWCIRNPVTLEADIMGAGKTMITIAVLNHVLADNARAIVVVPAYLRPKWKRDLQQWRTGKPSVRNRIHIARSRSPVPTSGIVLCSYETLRDNTALQSADYAAAVFDESHFIKNPSAKRTRAARAIQAPRLLFLSGTPHYNKPRDLFVPLAAAAPSVFTSARQFAAAHHIANPRSLSSSERHMLHDLGAFLRNSIMIRRPPDVLLADLPPDLPPEMLPLPIREAEEIARQEQQLLDQLSQGDAAPALFAQLAQLRRLVGNLKVPALRQHLRSLAESGAPHLVFTHHRDIAERICKSARAAGTRAEFIHGGIPAQRRDNLATAFQSGSIDCLCCTMSSCGAGIDLFRATSVTFAELDWSPATMSQAKGRARRPGQKHPVHTYFALADGTVIDYMIASLIASKSDAETSAMGDLSPASIASLLESKSGKPANGTGTPAPPPGTASHHDVIETSLPRLPTLSSESLELSPPAKAAPAAAPQGEPHRKPRSGPLTLQNR